MTVMEQIRRITFNYREYSSKMGKKKKKNKEPQTQAKENVVNMSPT